MKLRNKKTGEVKEGVEISIWIDHEGTIKFPTLAELNAEWEDYKPAEPLIKDPKIRKAVRAWAEAIDYNYITCELYNAYGIEEEKIVEFVANGDYIHRTVIEFCDDELYRTLKESDSDEGKRYTIEDLCGEE